MTNFLPLFLFIVFLSFANITSNTRRNVNYYLEMDRIVTKRYAFRRTQARRKACGSRYCKNQDCEKQKYNMGWNILGSDWGCCGNYDGCCRFAYDACFLHDRICTCCSPGWFCFSGCQPDPGCKIKNQSTVNASSKALDAVNISVQKYQRWTQT